MRKMLRNFGQNDLSSQCLKKMKNVKCRTVSDDQKLLVVYDTSVSFTATCTTIMLQNSYSSYLITSKTSGIQEICIVPLTIDAALLAEVDHVHQQLPAGGADEAARVPTIARNFAGNHGWTAHLHLLLAVVTSLGETSMYTCSRHLYECSYLIPT